MSLAARAPRRPTDVVPAGARLHLLPVEHRVPLKFGHETVTRVTCARVRLTVEGTGGARAAGWGETPLSVQWVWPSALPWDERHQALLELCRRLTAAYASFARWGHALEVGHAFLEEALPAVLARLNAERAPAEPIPHLAALVCASPFDLALHDAYGRLHDTPVYGTYDARWMTDDLARFLEPAPDGGPSFAGRYPADYLVPRADSLPAWHLVGGVDPLTEADLRGDEPADDHPVLLGDWIQRDGLECLKIKLRGTDADWDHARVVAVGGFGARWLSLDFNCTVHDPAYVNGVLDRLRAGDPALFERILYVEQPFPYDLERHRIDVREVAARRPLFMDESAHDWRLVRLGRSLGWTGVALKTCKTQTGALLALAWAHAHGMSLMVQDLTNPMLAMIPHALLAAHAGTIMGVETNQSQFCPDASRAEAAVHPGLYRRRGGRVELGTLHGPGFGYGIERMQRSLPAPAAEAGEAAP